MQENIDTAFYSRGIHRLCGIDEAGRGPLAGPLVAAAVILDPGNPVQGLADSKQLSAGQREKLFDLIIETALGFGIGLANVQEIERLNILQANFLAMRRAVQQLSPEAEYVLIDGRDFPAMPGHQGGLLPGQAIVKGDTKSECIAAASILAKVSRDRMMIGLAEEYPGYGFEVHKGYATKAHFAALEKYGVSPIHRRIFLRNWQSKSQNLFGEL